MRFFVRALFIAVCLGCGWVQAQTFPNRPVTIIVPYPPGGLIDLVARALQPFLQT